MELLRCSTEGGSVNKNVGGVAICPRGRNKRKLRPSGAKLLFVSRC